MTETPKKRVAIFVSGSGTNMENLARKMQAGELNSEIALVVCDNPNAFALKRAKRFGLEMFVVRRNKFKTKVEFENKIDEALRKKKVELIFLAGYMRILGPQFVQAWRWKILNIHPSLLPKYPGTHSIQEALEAKEKQTGVTIHFVEEGVDSGPIILQGTVPIEPGDTLETLEARVHATEYALYPEAIRLLLAGHVNIPGRA